MAHSFFFLRKTNLTTRSTTNIRTTIPARPPIFTVLENPAADGVGLGSGRMTVVWPTAAGDTDAVGVCGRYSLADEELVVNPRLIRRIFMFSILGRVRLDWLRPTPKI